MSTTAYLILSDPEIRMLFRAKANRMESGRWRGIGQEVAKNVVLELRDSFPAIFRVTE